jgi:TrmH RNA methyltransferase
MTLRARRQRVNRAGSLAARGGACHHPAVGREDHEVKVHGLNACLAVAARRPDDVLRAYVLDGAKARFGELFKRMALGRRPYRVVPPEELEAVSGSRHHEGVCLVLASRTRTLAGLLADLGPEATVLVVDRVGNPHNLGAIVRSAAHFGADAVIVEGEARPGGAVARTAEGGAEHVALVGVPSLFDALEDLRDAGFARIATSGRARRSLLDVHVPARVAWLLGSEAEGLDDRLVRASDATVAIPGTGDVESLNVAAAAAVILAETWRRRRAPG